MKFIIALCIGCFSLGLARETCESLLSDLERTLDQTQSLERKTTIKAGFIELASVSAVINRTPTGLEVAETEHSGRQLPDRPNGQEEGWLGPFGIQFFSCEGHSLKQTAEDRYELNLVDEDDATPPEDFRLRFTLKGERLVLGTLESRMNASGLPINPYMTVSFEGWLFSE